MDCLKTQVAAPSMINYCKFSVLFLTTNRTLTTPSSSAQYSDQGCQIQIKNCRQTHFKKYPNSAKIDQTLEMGVSS